MNIVEGWNDKKLSQLADYINGFAFKPEHWGRDGLPIVRIEQMKNPDSVSDYFSGSLPERNIINDGDLIFSWSASLFLRFWHYGTAALNQHLFKVVEKTGIDRAFLKFFIEFYLPELTKASHGSTMQHITRKELDRFSALFPDNEAEQTQIAAILSTIDKAIEQTEAIIAKQQRIKTGLMQDLLTRGIDKAGNIRSEATHEFKDSLLGRIPMAWEVKTLASVSEFITSGSRGWAQYYSVEGATFIRIGNLTREHINLRLDDIIHVQPPESSEGKRTSVLLGDILISITADLGIIGVVPANLGEAYVNQHVALLRPKETGELSRFWGWYLSSRRGQVQIEKLNESGAKAGLSLPSVGNLLVPDFSEREKVQITKQLDRTTNSIIDQNTRLAKLRRLKTGLMQDLLTGKVRVTDLFTPSNN